MKKSNSRKFKKPLLVVALALILLGGFVLWRKQTNKVPSPLPTDAKTTSTAPTAQENFTGGDNREARSQPQNEGTATDTGGIITEQPAQDAWSVSSSGQITLYSPSKNSLFQNGDVISGASTLSTVNFRLIDDVSGVIAEGSLGVVNGKFSGKFSFSTTGTNGRLDIFSIDTGGIENNNVEVPVRFK
jgi:hypothetical protein